MTEHDASEAGRLLEAFKELEENPAWQEVAALMDKAHTDSLDGSTARGRAHELRAEHIEAYHITKELCEWREKRMAQLRKSLREFQSQATAAFPE